PPEHVVDVLALLGDTIDNVPGVPGIGDKTADELLRAFGSLEGIYAHLDQVKKPSIRSRLETHREQAFLSRELVTVRTDLELACEWEDLRVLPIRPDAFRDLVTRYELRALERRVTELGRADEQAVASAPAPPPVLAVQEAAAEAEISAPEPIAPSQGSLDLWLEPGLPSSAAPADLEDEVGAVIAAARAGLGLLPWFEGDHPRGARLVGLALASAGGACYLPLAHEGGANVDVA